MSLQDGKSDVISMEEYPIEVVDRLLQFLYIGDYGEPDIDSEKDESSPLSEPTEHSCPVHSIFRSHVLAHIRMNAIGDRFQIEGLVQLANAKIGVLLQSFDKDEWISAIPEAIQEAASCTKDEQLTSMLATVTVAKAPTLLSMDTFRDSPALTPFATKVIEAFAFNCGKLSSEMASLRDECETLKENERIQQKEIEGFFNRAELARKCLGNLRKTWTCQSEGCERNWGCYIDFDASVLRCHYCGSQHESV